MTRESIGENPLKYSKYLQLLRFCSFASHKYSWRTNDAIQGLYAVFSMLICRAAVLIHFRNPFDF